MTILAEIEAGCHATEPTAMLGHMPCGPKSQALARPSIAQVCRVVADYYSVSVDDLLSFRERHKLAPARQMAMYVARQLCGRSLPVIAKAVGGRHHSTIVYGIEATAERIAGGRTYARDYREIVERIQGEEPAALHASIADPFSRTGAA